MDTTNNIQIGGSGNMRHSMRDIYDEQCRQEDKWGVQNHDPFVWLAILGEEVGEANQAALKAQFGGQDRERYRKECVHIAAVAVSMIECLDRHGGVPPAHLVDPNAREDS